jgi:protein associated with RNAse G/E
MTMPACDPPTFAAGSTVLRRDVFRGKVWTATPMRVVVDSCSELVLCHWPGTQMLAPTTWTRWLRTGDDAVRKQAIPNLAVTKWDLEQWTWRSTTVVTQLCPGEHFSVNRFLGGGDGSACWYVNFELPFRRTSVGVDTFDLFLDLVVDPDLTSYSWKDEDEYAHARRLGVIDDPLHRSIDEARQRAVALIEAREGPFGRDWSAWQRDPAWPVPNLRSDV